MNEETFKEIQLELARIYWDIAKEYEKASGSHEGWAHKYWQGKKDGMRIALSFLSQYVDDDRDWQGLQESSQKGRATELQILRSQVIASLRILNDIEIDGFDSYNKSQVKAYKKWIENCKSDFGFDYGEREDES